MKKVSVTIQYDEERLSTVKLFMEKKNLNIDDELEKFLDSLYTKHVPVQVRDFFEMKSQAEKTKQSSVKGDKK